MNDKTWEKCPTTTNPVEHINKDSKPLGNSGQLGAVLIHLYKSD